MTSMVERSMSVEFLDDMKMGRAVKTVGDKVGIQNYADRMKKCSSKSRIALSQMQRSIPEQEEHLCNCKTVLQFW